MSSRYTFRTPRQQSDAPLSDQRAGGHEGPDVSQEELIGLACRQSMNRQDVLCAAIASAPAATIVYDAERGLAGYLPGTFLDPAQRVASIPRDPAPRVFVIADPRDSVVSFSSQRRSYYNNLIQAGFPSRLIPARAQDAQHHNLEVPALVAARLCATGMSDDVIERQITRQFGS